MLSTHIVSDVSDLCRHLAIMNKGRVLVTGTPQELTDALAGRVWATSAERADVAALRERHAVISTRLHAGRTEVHVIADGRPGPAFEAIEPSLEDAYFAAIGGHLGDARGTVSEGRFVDAAGAARAAGGAR